jgi:acetyl-CoA carboxylase carboxyl transferase subunit alpha
MLQYSTYSVISPEGCASILWKSAEKAAEAAEALGITSTRLSELGLVDRVIDEPLGGAHRNIDAAAENISKVLKERASWQQVARQAPGTTLQAAHGLRAIHRTLVVAWMVISMGATGRTG